MIYKATGNLRALQILLGLERDGLIVSQDRTLVGGCQSAFEISVSEAAIVIGTATFAARFLAGAL
jgi:hypothetical protein